MTRREKQRFLYIGSAVYVVITATTRLDLDSTAVRLRYDHSTTYFDTVDLPVCGRVLHYQSINQSIY